MRKKFLASFFFKRRLSFHTHKRMLYPEPSEMTGIAAVQMRFRIFKRAKEFYEQIIRMVGIAKEKGAKLVCFPVGIDRELQPVPWKSMNDAQRRRVFHACDKAFSLAAVNSGICLSESVFRDGKFESKIWKPNGEKSEGKTVNCCGRKVFFSHYDFEEEEVAEICVFPRFGDISGRKISKAWLDAQQEYVFTVESKLIGEYSGTNLKGKAGIYAPLELSPFGDGILAISSSEEDEVIEADLDFEELGYLRNDIEDDAYKRLLI